MHTHTTSIPPPLSTSRLLCSTVRATVHTVLRALRVLPPPYPPALARQRRTLPLFSLLSKEEASERTRAGPNGEKVAW